MNKPFEPIYFFINCLYDPLNCVTGPLALYPAINFVTPIAS